MGIFKEINNLKKQGKEIAKETGQPTGMLGMLKGLPDQLAQANQMVSDARTMQADIAREQQILASGTRATATVTGLASTGTLVNNSPLVVIDLKVNVNGQPEYAAQISSPVPHIYMPQLQVGSTVAVRVDAANQSLIALDWANQGQVG
jgi:hypothetical protein